MKTLEEAKQLTDLAEQAAELEKRLLDYQDDDLLQIIADANSWDFSFEHLQAYEIEDFVELVDISPNGIYALIRSIVYGDVDNMHDFIRYDSLNHLESVSRYQLAREIRDEIDSVAEWVTDHFNQAKECLYEEECELLEAWGVLKC